MFFPASTDAPVYHFPAATIGLIVTNVVAFVATGVSRRPDLVDPWMLWFGELHVLQWLTTMFMHAGFWHLLVNMVFLWAFGLVVEGKLGWWRFLLIYLALGFVHSGAEQALMLSADREQARVSYIEEHGLQRVMDEQIELAADDEDLTAAEFEFLIHPQGDQIKEVLRKRPLLFGDLGAAGALFSLLAMSLIWAPKNEMTIVGLLGLKPITFEVSIMMFAMIYFVVDLVLCWWYGFGIARVALHSLALIPGALLGVALFKTKIVDCEDWDIFAVLSGKYGPHVRDIYGYRNERGKKTRYDDPFADEGEPKAPEPKADDGTLDRVNQLIDESDFLTAAEELFSLRIKQPRSKLSEDHLREICMGLFAEQELEEAELLLEEYIEQFPTDINWACVRLAAIQLQQNQQPRAAFRTLQQVNKETLTDREKELGRKLSQEAKKQIQAGVQDRDPEF